MNKDFRIVVFKADLRIVDVISEGLTFLIPEYNQVAIWEEDTPPRIRFKWDGEEFLCHKGDNEDKITMDAFELLELLQSSVQIIIYNSSIHYFIDKLYSKNIYDVGILLSFDLDGLRLTLTVTKKNQKNFVLEYKHGGIY